MRLNKSFDIRLFLAHKPVQLPHESSMGQPQRTHTHTHTDDGGNRISWWGGELRDGGRRCCLQSDDVPCVWISRSKQRELPENPIWLAVLPKFE